MDNEFPELSHEQLLAVFKQFPSDYKPWGERSDDERGADCSCGCKWYHVLEGTAGMDWGVCGNPESPRAGLLTFEHQGCRQVEIWEESDGH